MSSQTFTKQILWSEALVNRNPLTSGTKYYLQMVVQMVIVIVWKKTKSNAMSHTAVQLSHLSYDLHLTTC